MLYKQTTTPILLKVLDNLMQDEMLKDFVLVGGTALSLRFGHRKSIDIDLFSTKPIEQNLVFHLSQNSNRNILDAGKYIITFIEQNVKVDLGFWNTDFGKIDEIEGIRMANPHDIFAMKFDAITTRKVKKDFFDIYELCQHFSFHIGFESFNKKFPYSKNSSIIFKAFGDINEADSSETPEMLNDLEWDFVKEKLKNYAKRYFFETK